MSTITLEDLKKQPVSAPYTKSVRVKVVAVGEQRHYRDQAGEPKTCLNVGVADLTDTAKVVIYDVSKFARFVEGSTIIMRNVITKPYGFVVTQQTRICTSVSMESIPELIETAARDIIRPPAAPVQPLNVAIRSPPRQRVSVAGKILMEEDKHDVMVNKNSTSIRNIFIQDATLKRCKVALWREYADADVKPGDYVTITDVVTYTFRNETSLSTTSFTKIEKTDAPEENREYICEGVCKENEGFVFLLSDDSEVLEVEKEIVEQALETAGVDTEDVEGFLSSKCNPLLRFKATHKGSVITNLVFIDI